jgi:hypothetical protein
MPLELHTEILSAHDEFHRIAAEIIVKIKGKRFSEARADISSEGPLNRTSARLSASLLRASLHEGAAQGTPAPSNTQAQESENPASLISPPPEHA